MFRLCETSVLSELEVHCELFKGRYPILFFSMFPWDKVVHYIWWVWSEVKETFLTTLSIERNTQHLLKIHLMTYLSYKIRTAATPTQDLMILTIKILNILNVWCFSSLFWATYIVPFVGFPYSVQQQNTWEYFLVWFLEHPWIFFCEIPSCPCQSIWRPPFSSILKSILKIFTPAPHCCLLFVCLVPDPLRDLEETS